MKPAHLFIVLALALATLGCTENQPKACTMEAKLCPDGSAVGRNASNNCEFDPCSGFQYCDAATMCEEGACYKFEDLDRPVCWQGENPCERCASLDCSILESYPAQIICAKLLPPEISPETPTPAATEPEPTPLPDTVDDAPCINETAPDDCYYKSATAGKDASICSKIAALNKKDGCYYVVALQTKDERICLKISDPLTKDQCDHLFNRP